MPPLPQPVKKGDHVYGALDQRAVPDRYFYVLNPETNEVWELDGYQCPGNENAWTIHLYCPKCRQNLKLETSTKQVQVTADGLESGEPIECSWPAEFGGKCIAVFEFGRTREQVTLKDGRKVTLDAVLRRARHG